jgi:glyoxylase-like metal-dependent hydrolase (beta-lactamase superfamily II)
MLTNGNYQSLIMTTGEGVVLVDAPDPLVQYIGPAVSDVTDEPIRTLIYSHGHSDHIGGAHLLAGPGLEIIAEHEAILDAALARDADLACALLKAHYRATADIVVNMIDNSAKEKTIARTRRPSRQAHRKMLR